MKGRRAAQLAAAFEEVRAAKESRATQAAQQLIGSPATSTPVHVVQEAMERTIEQAHHLRNFSTVLNIMPQGDRVSLQTKGEEHSKTAMLMKKEHSCLLVHADGAVEELLIESNETATKLAATYQLPQPSKAELIVEAAVAMRKRQARHAAALCEEEAREGIEAATKVWFKKQAEMADSLGLSLQQWKGISDLLLTPPPMRVGKKLIMSSIAIGRSMVLDASVEAAVAAPLRESVKAAAERAAEQPQGRKRKEASVPLITTFGKDVTEVLADIEVAEHAAEEKQAAKRQRAMSVARRRSMQADEKVRAACKKLLGCGGAGGAKHRSIQDLPSPDYLARSVGQQQQDGRAGIADDASDDDDEKEMEVDEDEEEEVTTADADDNNSGSGGERRMFRCGAALLRANVGTFGMVTSFAISSAIATSCSTGTISMSASAPRPKVAVIVGAVLREIAAEVEKQGGKAVTVCCDVSSDDSVAEAFEKAREVGEIEVLVFNAAPPYPPGVSPIQGTLPKPHELDTTQLQSAFNIGVSGCVRCFKHVIGPMVEAGRGTVLVTGASMALRGHPDYSCMSPVKFALRSLVQSMSREYCTKGVHISHILIDGAIASPQMTDASERLNFALLDPKDLAEQYMALVNQGKGAWTYELQLTPPHGDIGMRI
ncbi:MAG: hypothetical protein SGPRY_014017 [Prymnesium sp.]